MEDLDLSNPQSRKGIEQANHISITKGFEGLEMTDALFKDDDDDNFKDLEKRDIRGA